MRWIALALVLALAATSCSDAPTAKEIEKADDGVDPSMITVLMPKELERAVVQLGTEFALTTSGVTFNYVVTEAGAADERLTENFRPSIWIDANTTIAPYASDGRALGAPAPFGENHLVLAAHKDRTDQPPSLELFGDSASPLRTGLCAETELCGIGAREALEQAGITPEPDQVLAYGKDLTAAVLTGGLDAIIAYRNEVARVAAIVDIAPLPDPEIGKITYESMVFGRVPAAAEFQRWIATSPDAAAVLVKLGFLRSDAGTT